MEQYDPADDVPPASPPASSPPESSPPESTGPPVEPPPSGSAGSPPVLTAAQWQQLWRGSTHTRNWQMAFADYRDAYILLLATTLPHLARLAIPRYLQPPLVDFFQQYGPDHHFYVEPCRSGERVLLTIWRPSTPAE